MNIERIRASADRSMLAAHETLAAYITDNVTSFQQLEDASTKAFAEYQLLLIAEREELRTKTGKHVASKLPVFLPPIETYTNSSVKI